jgi:hypothetical protein
METSNCRFEFLIDQMDAAHIADDFEQIKRIEWLMDLENKYFGKVADRARFYDSKTQT